jgi:ABC-2 type transport system ATP-binding protein
VAVLGRVLASDQDAIGRGRERTPESMITLDHLTKRYGAKTAVDHLSCTVRSGAVTGFLGPNGSGKSTTMRLVLGLDHPSSGFATVNGRQYADLDTPLRTVGALLDPRTGHPGQSARNHLLGMARSNGIPAPRVDEVLGTVGLSEVADQRIRSFSLGMGQRLGIGAALLGDPGILILDEPVNGLDPDGVLWIRRLMRSLAAEGRTVFVSSHLMSEMQETADHLIVIGRGTLIVDAPVDEVIGHSTLNSVRVRSPQAPELHRRLAGLGLTVVPDDADGLRVTGAGLERIGAVAFAAGLQVDELSFQRASLEQAYMELTGDSVEYGALLPTPRTSDAERAER